MESEFLCLQMRSPPPPFLLRGVISPLYPVHTTMIFQNNTRFVSRRFLFSVRLYSSSSSALNVIEQNYSDNSFYAKPRGFKKIIPKTRVCNQNEPSVADKINNGVERARRRIGSRMNLDLAKTERLKWYSEVLRDCVLNWSLNEGKAIHGRIIKSGIDPDMHLWVSLINFYAKIRCLGFARKVLDEMPERDVVSYTALISGYLAHGCSNEGVYLFREMQREGILPNQFTLATALKACSVRMDKELGKQIHTQVIKLGVFEDLIVGSALVDLYAKCSDMQYADKVFFLMPERNDVSWNALLNGYAQIGDGEQLLRLFCTMEETQMKFTTHTLSTVINGCSNSGNFGTGRQIHAMGIKTGWEDEDFVSCSLVDLYSKCGIADDALKVFSRIKNPDIVTWSAMIRCLHQQNRSQEAVELYRSMKHMGLNPNQFTLASLVKAATDLGESNFCKSIHASIYKHGYKSETVLNNELITMYMKNGQIEDGYNVFRLMSHQDVVSWNTLLSGYQDSKEFDQATRVFKSMLVNGFKPNMYTFNAILKSCSRMMNLQYGKQIHAHVIKNGIDIDDGYVGTNLIDMYAKRNCLEDVEVIFDRLINRDVFTWTVMIDSYAQTDQGEKAVKYFNDMRKNGINPNERTLASCLKGCSLIANSVNGKQLHSFAIKTGHFSDIFVVSAIFDMYGKCGYIDDAEIIFKNTDIRDAGLWNTIICNYAHHGKDEKALLAFENMINEGVFPDEITFLGVLCACRNMGLIQEGRNHFESMSEIYNIRPSIKHLACVVDILGRAGKFDEVESFIEKMELNSNGLILESVLGSCSLHGNEELAEKTAEKLFEIEPKVDSNYILLSNIYAAKGKRDRVSKIRALMTKRGVKKEPGCSWVEVDSRIHTFLSQDSSHPMITKIYQKLDELGKEATKLGYIPKTEYVLQNVTEREKIENLNHHSERLALAFSLINDIPNKPIRIFKNLRICGDCHEYMKITSNITGREIVVRDAHLFHHFQNGECSCQDYW